MSGSAEPAAPAGVATPPRVVALVPAWRAAAFIDETLHALAAQTYPNFEVLISDDASPDDTAARCEAFAAHDPRFRVIRQSVNLGWVGNVNALLAAARGEWLLFAFQDDLPEPGYVAKCMAALAANPRAVLAFSDIALVHQDGTREEKSYVVLDGERDRLVRARRVAAQDGSWWIPNRGVFRAEAAGAIGGLHRHRAGEFSADWPWLLRMSLLGEFVRVPERLVTKIYQPRSLSRSWGFSARAWLSVTRSAVAAVERSRIPLAERVVLQGALVAFVLRPLWRAMLRAAGRTLRRLKLLPAAPAAPAGPASRGSDARASGR